MTATARSSSLWLWVGYGVLVTYASLYPFAPWSWPGALPVRGLFELPWPHYWGRLDIWANAVGYVPLGFLGGVVAWRHGRGAGWAAFWGGVMPSLLAYTLEVLQHFLPNRVPSLADWALNSVGAWLGVGMAGALIASGRLRRATQWRERWFHPHAAGALALLACWPLGLLFPAPVPLAQGQFLPEAYGALRAAVEASAWAQWPEWPQLRSSGLLDFSATALGLMAPCSLVLASARGGWHRGLLIVGALLVGVGVSSLAAALGFGPDKAWSWTTPQTVPALAVATGMALALAWLPGRWNAVLALVWLTLLLAVANLLPNNPYLDASHDAWLGGTQIRLYGLLQWIGRLWPVLALAWLVASLARRET